jgi:hypothetical protein
MEYVHPVQQIVAHAAHGHFIIPWWQQLWDGSVSAQGSQSCTLRPDQSVLHQFDALIAASWFVVTFLGIGCLVRTKRFWRRRITS